MQKDSKQIEDDREEDRKPTPKEKRALLLIAGSHSSPSDEKPTPPSLVQKKRPPKKKMKISEDGLEQRMSHDQRWNEMFARLQRFKEIHGHCNVPNRYAEDTQLGSWVSAQRRQYRIVTHGEDGSAALTPERANKLVQLGFEWSTSNPNHTPWDTRFEALKNFVKRFGHAEVPMRWNDDPKLSHWVSKQRHDFKLRQEGKSSRLTDEKIRLLNEVRFRWEGSRRSVHKKMQDISASVTSADTSSPNSSNVSVQDPGNTTRTNPSCSSVRQGTGVASLPATLQQSSPGATTQSTTPNDQTKQHYSSATAQSARPNDQTQTNLSLFSEASSSQRAISAPTSQPLQNVDVQHLLATLSASGVGASQPQTNPHVSVANTSGDLTTSLQQLQTLLSLGLQPNMAQVPTPQHPPAPAPSSAIAHALSTILMVGPQLQQHLQQQSHVTGMNSIQQILSSLPLTQQAAAGSSTFSAGGTQWQQPGGPMSSLPLTQHGSAGTINTGVNQWQHSGSLNPLATLDATVFHQLLQQGALQSHLQHQQQTLNLAGVNPASSTGDPPCSQIVILIPVPGLNAPVNFPASAQNQALLNVGAAATAAPPLLPPPAVYTNQVTAPIEASTQGLATPQSGPPVGADPSINNSSLRQQDQTE